MKSSNTVTRLELDLKAIDVAWAGKSLSNWLKHEKVDEYIEKRMKEFDELFATWQELLHAYCDNKEVA